jgi:hypothetical protein
MPAILTLVPEVYFYCKSRTCRCHGPPRRQARMAGCSSLTVTIWAATPPAVPIRSSVRSASEGAVRRVVLRRRPQRRRQQRRPEHKPLANSDLSIGHATKVASSPAIAGTQDSGFFTSVSSAGATEPIIWAVSRPSTSWNGTQCVGDPTVNLYAFDAGGSGGGTLPQLFEASAATWPSCNGNANIVPVEANSKVYVADYKQLSIFGLK